MGSTTVWPGDGVAGFLLLSGLVLSLMHDRETVSTRQLLWAQLLPILPCPHGETVQRVVLMVTV